MPSRAANQAGDPSSQRIVGEGFAAATVAHEPVPSVVGYGVIGFIGSGVSVGIVARGGSAGDGRGLVFPGGPPVWIGPARWVLCGVSQPGPVGLLGIVGLGD